MLSKTDLNAARKQSLLELSKNEHSLKISGQTMFYNEKETKLIFCFPFYLQRTLFSEDEPRFKSSKMGLKGFLEDQRSSRSQRTLFSEDEPRFKSSKMGLKGFLEDQMSSRSQRTLFSEDEP